MGYNRTINKGCLQKPRWQTPYHPVDVQQHASISPAKRDPDKSNMLESAYKLREYILAEEAEIERRYYK